MPALEHLWLPSCCPWWGLHQTCMRFAWPSTSSELVMNDLSAISLVTGSGVLNQPSLPDTLAASAHTKGNFSI